MWATTVILKTTQSKQSPNRRKFAQSGHPGLERFWWSYSNNVGQMQVDNAFDVGPRRVDRRMQHEAGHVHAEVGRPEVGFRSQFRP
jgi:hypothetical protein